MAVLIFEQAGLAVQLAHCDDAALDVLHALHALDFGVIGQ